MTIIFPEAPVPTMALILVSPITVKEEAAVPPKLTEVAPERCDPLIATVVPVPALVGEKDVICGAGGGVVVSMNVNPARESVPLGPDTNTDPLAPVPKTAAMAVSERMVKDDAAMDGPLAAPKLTMVEPVKEVPRICMVVPVPALVGEKEVMIGVPNGDCAKRYCVKKTAIKNRKCFFKQADMDLFSG
jgi:hypothetical protein